MKKLLALITALALTFSVSFTPMATVSAETKNTSQAAILTGCAGDSDGVMCILKLVVDIMSIGIGILGVIGITIVGIQYLTAGGDEGKTRKAKQRMFEIVIGLVTYVVIYAILRWLLPTFNGV